MSLWIPQCNHTCIHVYEWRPCMQASALAFASGMATAGSSCEPPLCSVSVQDTADAFFPAIAEAAAAALQQGCTDGETGTLNLEQFESVMSVSSVESIAAVLVQVRRCGGDCVAPQCKSFAITFTLTNMCSSVPRYRLRRGSHMHGMHAFGEFHEERWHQLTKSLNTYRFRGTQARGTYSYGFTHFLI